MTDFEKLYDRFQITNEKCGQLMRLTDPVPNLLPRPMDRVVVETVIVENGERRVVKKEAQCAKLV